MTVKKITPEQLFEKMQEQGKVVLLDVRAEEKYKNYHIEDNNIENFNIVKNKIFDMDDTFLESLPKDKEIIVTCTTGNSAAKCAAILSEKEYDVAVLEGGVTAWKKFLGEM